SSTYRPARHGTFYGPVSPSSPSGGNSVATGPRRPRFYATALAVGFLLGGFLQALMVRILSNSPAKTFFTYSLHGQLGPVSIDLLVLSFALGPLGVNVSILSVLGVVVAYAVAKSLF